MNTNSKNHLIEIPVGGNGGVIWNQLHSEREDICEALLKDPQSMCGVETTTSTRNWHLELLQSRLRKIDASLDRLMSGSYGHCSNCGQWIGDYELELDPAKPICVDCSENQNLNRLDLSISEPIHETESNQSCSSLEIELALEMLQPFDTILVRTLNSDYRILLLNPKTGRALVEGGQYLTEPKEALIAGSSLNDYPFKPGSIAVGYHLVMCVEKMIVNTSRIQSINVQNNAPAESIEPITAAVH